MDKPFHIPRDETAAIEYALSLIAIRKSVDRLADAVRRGIYDARSTVDDEVLNMMLEFEGLEDLLPSRKEEGGGR